MKPGSRVLISGASGLIGSALAESLTADGFAVQALVRQSAEGGGQRNVLWQPDRGITEPARVDGIDAVVHLAGANIADGRWTARRKKELVDSRVPATERLIESLASLPSPPKIFLCASAVGYYGPDRFEPATEEADAGDGFLAQLCVDWENAAETARQLGCRVIRSRFSVVLSKDGGALKPRCCYRSDSEPGVAWEMAASTFPGSRTTTLSGPCASSSLENSTVLSTLRHPKPSPTKSSRSAWRRRSTDQL